MPNERYVKISMKGRWDEIPYDSKGDPNFANLDHVRRVFTDAEVVNLCNKALYTMKYQRETHANRRAKGEKGADRS